LLHINTLIFVKVENAAADDDAEAGDIEDEVDLDVEEDVLFNEAANVEISEVSLDSSAHHILVAQVDPVEWKTELERVGPKLRAQQQLPTNDGGTCRSDNIQQEPYREGAARDSRGPTNSQ